MIGNQQRGQFGGRLRWLEANRVALTRSPSSEVKLTRLNGASLRDRLLAPLRVETARLLREIAKDFIA